jgi:hypothetical protein
MAYMNQEKKAALAPTIKAILKKYGIKGSIAVRNHMTLVVNIKSGKIDFIENYLQNNDSFNADQVAYLRKEQCMDINPYWYQDHFTGDAKAFLSELLPAMNVGNHNNSDIQTDYFDVGWYVDVNIGQWNKPYELVK